MKTRLITVALLVLTAAAMVPANAGPVGRLARQQGISKAAARQILQQRLPKMNNGISPAKPGAAGGVPNVADLSPVGVGQ